MSDRKFNVLFLCTGNSARSIMAEACINNLSISRGKFVGYSAGSHPKGRVHPMAMDLLKKSNMPTEGLRSKSWDEFAKTDAPVMDFVFTVCDNAAGEQCPYWPGQPMTAHWGVPDPAAVDGSEEEQRRAFVDAYAVLRRRIELLASLPLEKLDRLALEQAGRGNRQAVSLGRRLVAEGLGTAFLLAAVVGSGIMGERLAGGNVALALLANSIATGAALVALILTLRPDLRRALQSGRDAG